METESDERDTCTCMLQVTTGFHLGGGGGGGREGAFAPP